jgi:hypothetical protein
VRGFQAHCPTRFGTCVFIGRDVINSKEALKKAADGGAFKAAGRNDIGKQLGAYMSSFWVHLEAAVELMLPIMDAIHQIEGDRAMLSQLRPMCIQLMQHAETWQKKYASTSGLKAVKAAKLFRERMDKGLQAGMTAAYILDPAFFEKNGDAWKPPAADLTAEEWADVRSIVTRLSGASGDPAVEGDVAAEVARLQICNRLPDKMTFALPHLTKRQDSDGGKMMAPAAERVSYWEVIGREFFPLVSKAAARLLSLHVTSCAAERNWSVWGRLYSKLRARLSLQVAEKLVFIAQNSKNRSKVDDEELLLRVLTEGDEQP